MAMNFKGSPAGKQGALRPKGNAGLSSRFHVAGLAKEFIGLTVYAPDKAKIGAISDLILSKDAKTAEGFVVGVGGFLGIGEKSVALKMDRLQIQQYGDGGLQLVMDVKKEELSNAPSFKSKRDQDAEKLAAERARNRPQLPGSPAQRPGTN